MGIKGFFARFRSLFGGRLYLSSAHLKRVDYVLVEYSLGMGRAEVPRWRGVEPMLALPCGSVGVAVFPDVPRLFGEGDLAECNAQMVSRDDLWSVLSSRLGEDDVSDFVYKQFPAFMDELVHHFKSVPGEHQAQFGLNVFEALGNYPFHDRDVVGARCTMESLYLVYLYYRDITNASEEIGSSSYSGLSEFYATVRKGLSFGVLER